MEFTSHQLARELLDGPDLPVHMSYDYGDRQHTTVCPTIGHVEEARVRYSNYHLKDRLIDEDADQDHDDARDVIVLS